MEHGSFLDDEDDDPTIQNGHVPSIGYTYIYIWTVMIVMNSFHHRG